MMYRAPKMRREHVFNDPDNRCFRVRLENRSFDSLTILIKGTGMQIQHLLKQWSYTLKRNLLT